MDKRSDRLVLVGYNTALNNRDDDPEVAMELFHLQLQEFFVVLEIGSLYSFCSLLHAFSDESLLSARRIGFSAYGLQVQYFVMGLCIEFTINQY